MSVFRSFVLISLASLLGACSLKGVTEWVDPYRIDIRQGNFVDQEMVSQLRKGMTREQVRYVLGTPLVVDTFRPDRWDYVYLFSPGRGEAERRLLSVFFERDQLVRVEGDVTAAGAGQADAEEAPARNRVVEVPAAAGKK